MKRNLVTDIIATLIATLRKLRFKTFQTSAENATVAPAVNVTVASVANVTTAPSVNVTSAPSTNVTSPSVASTTLATAAKSTIPSATTAPTATSPGVKVSSGACQPWPDKLKPYQDCCVIPYHANQTVEQICFFEACNKTKLSNGTMSEMSTECYLKAVNLMSPDGKFNKEVAKAIYKGFSDIYKNFTGNNPWAKVIDEAVDKCVYPTTPNKTNNMMAFYSCTNLYLKDNCVTIDSRDECDPVLEQYEKCKGITPDCKAWPLQIMLPEFCCIYPELITSTIRNGCRAKCITHSVHSERALCTNTCIYKTLAVKVDGKYDFQVVKKVLIANANKGWDKAVDKAVDSCKEIVQG